MRVACLFVNAKVITDVSDHRTVEVREDMRAGVVQRVVEVEQPDW
jgi:hypothetical protein